MNVRTCLTGTCSLINKWRYLEDDGCTSSLGLATDEFLARHLPPSPYSHTLRLYAYGERCALVGKYQEVSSEINVEYCKTHAIAINRRPTGGGAIIMGKGQLGVAIAMPLSEDFSLLKLSMVFKRYSLGILLGLERLGLRGEFRRGNDILVGGKKIAGMAFATIDDAGLFHASLLADLDEELMQMVLRIPRSKTATLTTASRELGRAVTTEEMRQAVKEGYQKAFGIEMAPKPLRQEEVEEIDSLEKAKYKNPIWIFGPKSEFRSQEAEVRTKKILYSDY
ncbi:MAG TPA: lipoate--protein ligase family protein [Candidatus Hypogeohydataceae bacterium YC41]